MPSDGTRDHLEVVGSNEALSGEVDQKAVRTEEITPNYWLRDVCDNKTPRILLLAHQQFHAAGAERFDW